MLWFYQPLKPYDGKGGKEVCAIRSRKNKHGGWMISRTGSVWFSFLHSSSISNKFNGLPTSVWNSLCISRKKTLTFTQFVFQKATKCFPSTPWRNVNCKCCPRQLKITPKSLWRIFIFLKLSHCLILPNWLSWRTSSKCQRAFILV